MKILNKFIQHFLTMAAGTFKDPINSILVYTHNSGRGADTITFSYTFNYSLYALFIQMKTKENCIAAFRESGLTGSASKQFGFVFTICIEADYVILSLFPIILTFFVGTITLRYIHGYTSDYVRLF